MGEYVGCSKSHCQVVRSRGTREEVNGDATFYAMIRIVARRISFCKLWNGMVNLEEVDGICVARECCVTTKTFKILRDSFL